MRVTAVESVTLDGVMQAPGRPDEDTRDGFAHGGWAVPYADEVMAKAMGARMARARGALLLGRRTYEDLYGYWPGQPPNPYTEALNRARKHVASRTLSEPLEWANATLLEGDAADAVAALRSESADDLTIIGSGALVRALAARGLVDAYVLLIHPVVLGGGQRLFDGGVTAKLRLTASVTTTTGVIIADYETIA